jgi:hypothetical protein
MSMPFAPRYQPPRGVRAGASAGAAAPPSESDPWAPLGLAAGGVLLSAQPVARAAATRAITRGPSEVVRFMAIEQSAHSAGCKG